jgi:hypothetical protein
MEPILKIIRRNPDRWFYACWLLLNLVQSAGTQLLDDEAYYWVYSRYLDWGYFDHPPMIAVLIRIGYSIFHNELGVRLLMAFMNTATLFLIQKMLPEKNDKLFYAIALSMGVLQIGGILAVPDIPLTFFTALFFFQYKRFLSNTNTVQAILLGVVMALMLYSKYHGILIILFTFLSNLKLFGKWQTWLAAFCGILLFFPHLWWQYVHDFPSVQYHLKERNAPQYRFSFTIDYLIGQLLLAGPLIGWLLFYAAGKFRAAQPFERALKFSLVGFYLFFLVSSLKGRVEANWTVPALVPLIILAHGWLSTSAVHARWVYRLMVPTLVAVFIVRAYMLTDIPVLTKRFHDEMHNNKTWAAAIREKASGLPVVFMNSYQRPSKYWFYTGDTSFTLNTTSYRRNNYNFWPIEQQFSNRPVYLVDKLVLPDSGATPIETVKEKTAGKFIPSFESFSSWQLRPMGKKLEVNSKKMEPFIVSISDSSGIPRFGFHVEDPLVLDIYSGDENVLRVPLELRAKDGGVKECYSDKTIDLPTGAYKAKLGLATSVAGLYSQNSASVALVVK